MTQPPPAIVIAGGGVAGWLAAAILAGAYGADATRICVVDEGGEDMSLGPFGRGVVARPEWHAFAAGQGWDEPALMHAAKGAFALGIAFDGWRAPRHSWFMPLGECGAAMRSIAFHHLAGRLRQEGREIRIADYALAAIAAQAGRFAHPSPDPRSPLSSYDYALHLDGVGLAGFLRDAALSRGAREISSRIAGLERRGDGGIAALMLGDGRRVAGDLFIDCTGAPARLVREMAGARFDGWQRWLPCDRAITHHEQLADGAAPYASHAAHNAGWVRHVPLDGAHALALIYASGAMTDQAAQASMDGAPIAYEAGRWREPWIANCVAIGAAAGLGDPLQGFDLQLALGSVLRLVRLLPHVDGGDVEAREYNRLTASVLDRARDAAILPYRTNGRTGQAFWDAARAVDPPETLAHKIALWESRGRVALYDDEALEEDDWVAMFEGMGVRPRRYDPLADAIPVDRIDAHLARLREVLTRAAQAMPRHADYLRGPA
ncbi:tryptophan 7-halogenase [Sphingomonas gilva]|uniref:Tryptophan 7-halogenase n=1 Tax=Sphingomonas gilva TaxID=2305907 RepID=A0A396RT70_9SPHN|nr:tryptophan halogenase family protein [Sphingomonas gilva]RHW17573.1 tryptophan 7-halogenase [Sphingomonas gilva]